MYYAGGAKFGVLPEENYFELSRHGELFRTHVLVGHVRALSVTPAPIFLFFLFFSPDSDSQSLRTRCFGCEYLNDHSRLEPRASSACGTSPAARRWTRGSPSPRGRDDPGRHAAWWSPGGEAGGRLQVSAAVPAAARRLSSDMPVSRQDHPAFEPR